MMKSKHEIVEEVAATMRFEGMLLDKNDQKRLENCVGKTQTHYQKIRRDLVIKYQKNKSKS